jgi:hypothetical protein
MEVKMKAKNVFSMLLITAFLFSLLPIDILSVYAATTHGIPVNGQITVAGLYDVTGYTGSQPVTVTTNGVGLTGSHNNLAIVINQNITLTLRDANIKCATNNSAPIRAGG